ncbi:helix-turn-helix domain-containing protein [Dysgonomonas sp. 25]|uniref:helix-turn-helix domain-containing protein n=1 Tax=Dysgonomonas sp. 25 TaxID=2302933 RepID=UPI0013D80C6F|nr:helix-turn-helix domain-containing protein [Dysgonomonas sp. 25]NDV68427.1 DNA-binding protein [Dysgonomonas sp. 25]
MDENLEMRVSALEKHLYALKKILSFEEASQFLNLSKSYLYQLTSKRIIPHYKPQGKMIYFERELLEDWLRQNPVRTKQEQQSEAANRILLKHRK